MHDNFISHNLARSGRLQPAEERFIQRSIESVLSQQSGPVHVLDVGGNIGYMALFAASISKRIRVTTIEPHPWHRRLLEASIALNGWGERVRVEPVIVTSQPEPPTCIYVADPANGGVTELKPGATHTDCTALGGSMVESTTIDLLLKASPFGQGVDVLKIDVHPGL